MNTQVFNIRPTIASRTRQTLFAPESAGLISISDVARFTARLVAAGAAAGLLFMFATWAAVTPALAQYLGAVLWAGGFVFLALAIEPGVKRVYPLALTGLALPALAVLGSRVAVGFTLVAAAIVAAWLAAWIVRRGGSAG